MAAEHRIRPIRGVKHLMIVGYFFRDDLTLFFQGLFRNPDQYGRADPSGNLKALRYGIVDIRRRGGIENGYLSQLAIPPGVLLVMGEGSADIVPGDDHDAR